MSVAFFNSSLVTTWRTAVCSFTALVAAAVSADDAIIEKKEIHPGVEYIHKRVQKVPWSIHILRFERNRPELEIVTTLPGGEYLGLSPTTVQMKFIPSEKGEPIGAINGDFFSWRKGPYQGDVAGLQIIEGEVVSSPHLFNKKDREAPLGSIAFWVDEKGKPHMDRVSSEFQITWPNGTKIPFLLNETNAENEAVIYTHTSGFSTRTTNGVELILEKASKHWLPLAIGETYSAHVAEIGRTNSLITEDTMVLSLGPKLIPNLPTLTTGMVLKISTASSPLLKNVKTAIGGGPWLAHEGKRRKFGDDPQRHPRAAMGYNDTHYFFVVADGRRQNISDGMTYYEMADEMIRLGCKEALNLDGGGSAMLWVDGMIRSQPSENRERPCANALVLVRKPSSH